MKTITVKQPWATLIVKGYKRYEFRSWKTKYRGEILIHAGKSVDKKMLKELNDLNFVYPSSKIIGKVVITDCIELDENTCESINKENYKIYGNKNRSGYAWKLGDPIEINSDKIINGKLSFWEFNEQEL